MRCDVNVSVMPNGSNIYGERNEIKNVNSKKFAKTAVEYESNRQIQILESGGTVSLNTLLFKQMFRDYLLWHETNHHLYPSYPQDKQTLKTKESLKYAYALGGVLLAATVINPNYTRRTSYYFRKINVAFFCMYGYLYG